MVTSRYKTLIAEKDGVELEHHEELPLDGDKIYFDNTSNGFVADNTQGAIEEISATVATSASPGFSFGKASNVNTGTFLNVEGVPSNKAGRWVYIDNAIVTKVFVSNEKNTSFTLEIMYHDGDGTNLTSLGTVSVVSAYGAAFTVSFPVPKDSQLCIRSIAGSPRNVVAGLELQGTN